MKGQTAIEGDRLNPPQPEVVGCEWCEEPSVDSLPITCRVKGKRNARTPSGMRVYFCAGHRETAQRFVQEPVR